MSLTTAESVTILLPVPRASMRSIVRLPLIDKLSKRFGLKCWYCGIGLRNQPVQIDHIVPVSSNGPDSIDNMALACSICNHAKWDLPLEKFVEWARRIRWLEDFPAKNAFAVSCVDVGDEEQPGDYTPSDNGAKVQDTVEQLSQCNGRRQHA